MVLPLPVLLIGAGAAVALAGGAFLWRAAERRRRESLEHFALVRGLRFDAGRPAAEADFAASLPLFAKGQGRKWGFTLSGARNGYPYTAFEYAWTTGGGQHSQRHCVHGMIWERSDGAFASFTLGPEGFLARLGQMLGMRDINFEDAPEFSRLYRLTGDDEAAVRQLFPHHVRIAFAAQPGQHLTAGGRHLVWYNKGRFPDSDQLDEWLERGDQARRLFLGRG